jgi:hypothetical protein
MPGEAPYVYISCFRFLAGADDAFRDAWNTIDDYMRTKPGYLWNCMHWNRSRSSTRHTTTHPTSFARGWPMATSSRSRRCIWPTAHPMPLKSVSDRGEAATAEPHDDCPVLVSAGSPRQGSRKRFSCRSGNHGLVSSSRQFRAQVGAGEAGQCGQGGTAEAPGCLAGAVSHARPWHLPVIEERGTVCRRQPAARLTAHRGGER